MDLYQAIVYAHIAAGSVALILFWTAGLMKKGTTSHRRVGQFYLLAMVGVMLSGLVMVQAAFNRGQTYAGIFLGFLVLLVATSFIFVNLIVDVIYVYVDPRIRYE